MSKITETISTPHQSSRNGFAPQLIVCHICDGSYEGTKAWFKNTASQVSSHFIVGQDGRICQCVGLDKMAWCNGTTTSSSDNRYFGLSTVPLVKKLGSNANYYSVTIEHEGYYSKTGGALTEAQLTATVWLIGHIREQIKKLYGVDIPVDREHIVGHYEINPITKPSCPGELFPWTELMKRLTANYGSTGPGNVSGDTAYKVQVGAFRNEEYARQYVQTVQEKGYDAFLVLPDTDEFFRVQVGYFESRTNAEQYMKEVEESTDLLTCLILCQKK